VLVNGHLQFAYAAIDTAVEVNDRILDGDELDPISVGNGDANRNPGIFDDLLLHNECPRSCTACTALFQ